MSIRSVIACTLVLAICAAAWLLAIWRQQPVLDSAEARPQLESTEANIGAASRVPSPAASRSAPAGLSPSFRDIAADAGLTVPHFAAAEGRFRLVETMGSGVGLIDYDGDGWLDIFIGQGCPLPIDPQQQRYTARLYRNRRDLTFEDVTESAGVGFNGYCEGVAVGDYDGDTHDDLFVAGFGSCALYHNNGNGTFTDMTASAGVGGGGWASSCAFADLDGDGDLDLYVAHYLANTIDSTGRPTAICNALPGSMGYCPPLAHAPEPDRLYRNNGDGTFTDVSADSGIGSFQGNGLGVVITDLDDDGRLDIFVANDQTPNLLFHNLGGLRFEEVALAWGLAYNETGQLRAGMGIASGDYDDDGRVDLLVTNFFGEASTLYRNAGPALFEVRTASARLMTPSRGKLGFGVGFLDYENDGRLDLFVANGHVNDVRPLGIPYQMNPQLFHNTGRGGFVEQSEDAGPYFRGEWLGRGVALGDLDNDGATDVVVTHIGRPPALLHNETSPRGHYLRISLQGAGTGGDATGARVTVEAGGRTQVRVAAAGGSYLAASDRRLLIGLGTADRVDRLTIRWPSGTVQTWADLPADQSLAVTEGGEPSPAVEAPPAGIQPHATATGAAREPIETPR